jgi:hypothetical protein
MKTGPVKSGLPTSLVALSSKGMLCHLGQAWHTREVSQEHAAPRFDLSRFDHHTKIDDRGVVCALATR